MKKLIISMAILVLIIAAGIVSINSFSKSSKQMVKAIEYTSSLVEERKWEKSQNEIDSIEKKWNKTENSWAMLIDHMEIDEIERALISSKEYIKTSNTSMALTELENLKFMIEHIYKKEVINLKNIF